MHTLPLRVSKYQYKEDSRFLYIGNYYSGVARDPLCWCLDTLGSHVRVRLGEPDDTRGRRVFVLEDIPAGRSLRREKSSGLAPRAGSGASLGAWGWLKSVSCIPKA